MSYKDDFKNIFNVLSKSFNEIKEDEKVNQKNVNINIPNPNPNSLFGKTKIPLIISGEDKITISGVDDENWDWNKIGYALQTGSYDINTGLYDKGIQTECLSFFRTILEKNLKKDTKVIETYLDKVSSTLKILELKYITSNDFLLKKAQRMTTTENFDTIREELDLAKENYQKAIDKMLRQNKYRIVAGVLVSISVNIGIYLLKSDEGKKTVDTLINTVRNIENGCILYDPVEQVSKQVELLTCDKGNISKDAVKSCEPNIKKCPSTMFDPCLNKDCSKFLTNDVSEVYRNNSAILACSGEIEKCSKYCDSKYFNLPNQQTLWCVYLSPAEALVYIALLGGKNVEEILTKNSLKRKKIRSLSIILLVILLALIIIFLVRHLL